MFEASLGDAVKENLESKCQVLASQECLSLLIPLILPLPQCLPMKCSDIAETSQKKAKMFPLILWSQGVKHTRADMVQQPQPRAPTWSYHRYLLLLSAAYYYCLLWTCSTMKTNSPRPCPITFGTIYLPVFFTLCDGFIYSINCGCHAAKWSYLPQREKRPGLCCAVVCFVLYTQNKS